MTCWRQILQHRYKSSCVVRLYCMLYVCTASAELLLQGVHDQAIG